MPRTIISEGKTSTEAIEKGLKELRVSRNQVEIKILEEKKKSLKKFLYKDEEENKLLSVKDYVHTKVEKPEIEDIMDENFIVDAVNREFHSEIEDFEFDNNSKKSIIEQIEEFAKENEITLEEGWKVKIAKRYVSKERNDNKDIVEKWKKLFNGFLEN